MIKPKTCARCGGDVHIEPGDDGAEIHCLQCGVRRWFSVDELRALGARPAANATGEGGPDGRAA